MLYIISSWTFLIFLFILVTYTVLFSRVCESKSEYVPSMKLPRANLSKLVLSFNAFPSHLKCRLCIIIINCQMSDVTFRHYTRCIISYFMYSTRSLYEIDSNRIPILQREKFKNRLMVTC